MNKPVDQMLWALEFKEASPEAIANSPALAELMRKIGPKPYDYARTYSIGLGVTLVRDVNGLLYFGPGQFDLKFHDRFHECGGEPQKK